MPCARSATDTQKNGQPVGEVGGAVERVDVPDVDWSRGPRPCPPRRSTGGCGNAVEDRRGDRALRLPGRRRSPGSPARPCSRPPGRPACRRLISTAPPARAAASRAAARRGQVASRTRPSDCGHCGRPRGRSAAPPVTRSRARHLEDVAQRVLHGVEGSAPAVRLRRRCAGARWAGRRRRRPGGLRPVLEEEHAVGERPGRARSPTPRPAASPGRLDRGRLRADVAHLVVAQARACARPGRRAAATAPPGPRRRCVGAPTRPASRPSARVSTRPTAAVHGPVVGRDLPGHHRLAEPPVRLHARSTPRSPGDRVEGERHARRPRVHQLEHADREVVDAYRATPRRTAAGRRGRARRTRWPSTARRAAARHRRRTRPRYVSYCPAKLAACPSSLTADDRTATRSPAPRPVRDSRRACAAATASGQPDGSGCASMSAVPAPPVPVSSPCPARGGEQPGELAAGRGRQPARRARPR